MGIQILSNLNMSSFKTVISDDFTKDASLNTALWTAHWGNSNQYYFTHTSAGLLLSGSSAAHWNPVGIEQSPSGKSAGEGYGLFSFTGYAGQAGQGVGICFVLWPSDNVWLPSSKPGQASEIDLLESWDKTVNGESTIHFYQAGSNHNGQSIHTISSIDLTVSHTYAVDWERGSLTFYVDGAPIYQDTTHVPLDAADGGVNETLGAEVVNEAALATTPTEQLYIQDISYSTPLAVAPPVASLALSAPGTVQEASKGAGVTVTEVVTSANLTSAYEAVYSAAGAIETGFAAVALNASGTTSLSVHLANNGDYVVIEDHTTSPTVTARSSGVTITDPAPVLPALAATLPGPLYTGVQTVTGTGGVAGLQLERITQGSYNSPGQPGWVAATVAADGSWSAALNFTKAGMLAHVYAQNGGGSTVMDLVNGTPGTPAATSSPPSLPPSPPPSPPTSPTITVSAPGSVQEASVGAGVTVTETVTTTNLSGSVYEEVLTKSGAIESGYKAVAIANGTATSSVHLAASGDTVRVVDNVASPTVTANSAAVTITDPLVASSPPAGAAAVAVAKPATLIVGQDLFSGVVTGGAPSQVKFAWHSASSGETSSSADMVAAARQADGSYSATLEVDHAGQAGYFYVAVNGVTTLEWSMTPVAATSAASAKPAFIASSTGSSSPTAGSMQAATTATHGTTVSVANDMVANAASTASPAASLQPDTLSSGAAMTLLSEPSVGLIVTDHA